MGCVSKEPNCWVGAFVPVGRLFSCWFGAWGSDALGLKMFLGCWLDLDELVRTVYLGEAFLLPSCCDRSLSYEIFEIWCAFERCG